MVLAGYSLSITQSETNVTLSCGISSTHIYLRGRDMKKWWRRRRFNKAYKILQKEAERHSAANHSMDFRVVNESWVYMICQGCPDHQP